jgi:hypothetical protein
MPQLDWIVEQDELPPDEPYYPAQDPEPPRRRRIPRWAWIVIGLVTVAAIALIVLWRLGGRDEPLPPPEPVVASLQAAVDLEIGALNSGDQEIYDRQQDSVTRRQNHQPPREVWFGPEEHGGRVTLLDLQPLGAEKARAEVRLDWEGQAYRLVWFYRQQDGRWLHTDWAGEGPVETRVLTTTHLLIEHHPDEAGEAAALAERTETLIAGLCGALPCPAEPVSLTLAFDPLYRRPYVGESGNYFTLPSPLRYRWPLNGEPEPMLMASLARHLAQRLVVPPASAGLSEESRDALILVVHGLAHDLLDLEPLPGTSWLGEVKAMEGREAVVALADAIRSGTPPQQAVRETLGPATVAEVTRLPGYLNWIALIPEPLRLTRAFDDALDPWAPPGEIYRLIRPRLVEVVFRDGWAIGITAAEGDLRPDPIFFRLQEGDWLIAHSPDASLVGEERVRVAGPFTITYYEWDEPYLEPVVEMLTQIHESVAANFGLPAEGTTDVLVMPYPNYPGGGAQITIEGPALNVLSGRPAVSDESLLMALGAVMSAYVELDIIPEDRMFMVIGLFLWQLEELGVEPKEWYDRIGFSEFEAWRPPETVDDPAWLPLAQLWQTPPGEPSLEMMAQYMWTPYMLTEYMVAKYGRDELRVIATELQRAPSVAVFVERVTGEPLREVEPAWRQWAIARWEER